MPLYFVIPQLVGNTTMVQKKVERRWLTNQTSTTVAEILESPLATYSSCCVSRQKHDVRKAFPFAPPPFTWMAVGRRRYKMRTANAYDVHFATCSASCISASPTVSDHCSWWCSSLRGLTVCGVVVIPHHKHTPYCYCRFGLFKVYS